MSLLGVVAHIYDPSTRKVEEEAGGLRVWGVWMSLCLQNKSKNPTLVIFQPCGSSIIEIRLPALALTLKKSGLLEVEPGAELAFLVRWWASLPPSVRKECSQIAFVFCFKAEQQALDCKTCRFAACPAWSESRGKTMKAELTRRKNHQAAYFKG